MMMNSRLRDNTIIDICKEEGLQFSISTNVVDEKSMHSRVRSTLKILGKILSGTLGPYGSTTIIKDKATNHFMSKDGYDVMNRIKMDGELSTTILEIVRSISSEQVLNVGDGSTSAIIISVALYLALTDPDTDIFDKVAPRDIIGMLDRVYDIMKPMIEEKGMDISEDLEELYEIATVSMNGDKKTGRMIKDLYEKIGEHGFITTDVVKDTEKDLVEIKRGIEWSRGFIFPDFARGYENQKIIHENPIVFISNGTLESDDRKVLAEIIGKQCGSEKRELLIIANGYDRDMEVFLHTNRMKYIRDKSDPFVFTAVDIAQADTNYVEKLKDIAEFAGCTIYDKSIHVEPEVVLLKMDEFIGEIELANITEKSTQLVGHNTNNEDNITERVGIIKSELDKELSKVKEQQNSMTIHNLRRRLAGLTDSTAIFHVGGNTIYTRKQRERLVEDAVFACKSALEHGYIVGGNLTIPRLIYNDSVNSKITSKLVEEFGYLPLDIKTFSNEFLKVIAESFILSYKSVLENSYLDDKSIDNIIDKCVLDKYFYNLSSHSFERDDETRIINSTETDIQILKTVISIIGSLATSNQMILDVPDAMSLVPVNRTKESRAAEKVVEDKPKKNKSFFKRVLNR
jgi:chaperonin GroEL